MHELSYTQHIFDTVMRRAAAENAVRVTHVRLSIGVMRGYVADFVQMYWSRLARGTIAENADIRIDAVPIRRQCRECGERYAITLTDVGTWACPKCASDSGDIVEGNELEITEIGIE